MGLFSFFKKKKEPKKEPVKEPKSAWDAVMDSRDFKEQNEQFDVMPEQNEIGDSDIGATKKVRPQSTPK